MSKIALFTGFLAMMGAGIAHSTPAAAQADEAAIHKSCVKQVRASMGLQKGQPMGKGSGRAVQACKANGGKL